MPATWTPFLAFEGIQGAIDKNGIETVNASYFVQTLEEARFWTPSDLASTVGLPMRRTRTYGQEWGNATLISAGKDGAYKVTFTLEGMKDPTTDESGVQFQEFETDGSLGEDDISTHPEIRHLLSKYAGTEDVENQRIVWEKTIPKGGATSGASVNPLSGIGYLPSPGSGSIFTPFSDALSASAGGSDLPNPLFGTRKFSVPKLHWTKTYATLRVSPDVTRRLGKIDVPPRDPNGYLPTVPDHHNWLKMVGKPVWRGNVYRVTESWESGSWNADIYR